MSECRWGPQPPQPPLAIPSSNLSRKLKDKPLARLRRHAAPAEQTSALGDSSWTIPPAPKKSPTRLCRLADTWQPGFSALACVIEQEGTSLALGSFFFFFFYESQRMSEMDWNSASSLAPITAPPPFYSRLSKFCQVSEPRLLHLPQMKTRPQCHLVPNDRGASIDKLAAHGGRLWTAHT